MAHLNSLAYCIWSQDTLIQYAHISNEAYEEIYVTLFCGIHLYNLLWNMKHVCVRIIQIDFKMLISLFYFLLVR